MKRALVLWLLVFIPLFAGTITKTLNFSEQDLMLYRVDDYDVVEIKGNPVLVNLGAPRMPWILQKLVIPAGAVPASVRIIFEEWRDIPGTFNVVPAQPDVPLPMPGKTFEPAPITPDPDIYSSAEPFPRVKIRNSGMGKLSGFHIAHVDVFPVRFIPSDGKLQLATTITYELEYREEGSMDIISSERQREVFGDAVHSIVANPEDVVRFAPYVGQNRGVSFVPPGYYEYVVISASPMDTVFERLADWKTKKGVPSTVVDISWISSTYTGYDLAEKVRNFIIDAHDNWGTIYVLLGGSGDYETSGQNIVPTRKAWYTYAGGPDGDSLPSDLYYGDLDGDWDRNGNHVYGQLSDSVDMYADVHVGRASVYNIAMAQNFVYKIFTYEKNPPTDYLKKMLLPTAILWSSYEERPLQDSIARMTPADWVDAKLYERNGLLSRPRMIDSMNVGYGMGHWVGHGNESGIYMGSSAYLNSTDANNLVNGDRQGIASSIGCMCGGWDLTPGSDCFAERLVNRVGGGLVAAIMNSRYGWGAYVSGYVPGPSERIDTSFFHNVLVDDLHHIGDAHSLSKDAWVFYADSGNQYDMTRWCIYELNLLGDPEMPLWTDVPMNLTVNYPAAVPVGFQNINISVISNGSPVSNALVCLQKGSEAYESDYTNAAGLVTLSVNPTSPGAMYITVTALNHYPYEDSLMVQPSNYAYVTFLSCSISDPGPGGNNNNQLNPGESAEMPVWVMNWGQSQGSNIVGILSASDSYTTLSDTLKNFGNVPAGDSAYTGADGFDVSISSSCPNGHAVLFTLTCRDDIDSTWVSQFSLNTYAPILVLQDYIVVGGNGILEPGETADIVVTLENEGGASAENITATLTSTSPYLTINDEVGTFGTITPGNIGYNTADPFNVTASASAAYGILVDCDLIIEAGLYTDTLDFQLAIGEPVPSDTGHYYVYYSGGL
ncbi:MAG: C25 family cysteine peptidase, partial [bacterium]